MESQLGLLSKLLLKNTPWGISSFHFKWYLEKICTAYDDILLNGSMNKKCVCFSLYSIFWCSYECCNPCSYVSILWTGCVWSQDPEILVVEEVPDNYPNGILNFIYCAVMFLLSHLWISSFICFWRQLYLT